MNQKKNLSLKIAGISFLASVVFFLASCQSQQVSYITNPKPSITISSKRHPVYVIVRDTRTEIPAPIVFKSDDDRRGALNPEVLKDRVYKDPIGNIKSITAGRLTENTIPISNVENDNTVLIEVSKFFIDFDLTSNMWKAHVIFNVTSDEHSQTINTTYQAANVTGNADGYKVISTAVSMSIDRITWDKLLPE
jgi:hypothetical protein